MNEQNRNHRNWTHRFDPPRTQNKNASSLWEREKYIDIYKYIYLYIKVRRLPGECRRFTCRRVSGFQLRSAFGDLSHHRVRVYQQKAQRSEVNLPLRPPPWFYTQWRRDVTTGSPLPRHPPHEGGFVLMFVLQVYWVIFCIARKKWKWTESSRPHLTYHIIFNANCIQRFSYSRYGWVKKKKKESKPQGRGKALVTHVKGTLWHPKGMISMT